MRAWPTRRARPSVPPMAIRRCAACCRTCSNGSGANPRSRLQLVAVRRARRNRLRLHLRSARVRHPDAEPCPDRRLPRRRAAAADQDQPLAQRLHAHRELVFACRIPARQGRAEALMAYHNQRQYLFAQTCRVAPIAGPSASPGAQASGALGARGAHRPFDLTARAPRHLRRAPRSTSCCDIPTSMRVPSEKGDACNLQAGDIANLRLQAVAAKP